MKVPFLDLKRQYLEIQEEVDGAIAAVLTRGRYILGIKLEAFEQAFSNYCGTAHAVGVGSGTDALCLTLRALRIGQRDEVITTPLTAFATAAAVLQTGATPVFADVEEDTLTLDAKAVVEKITPATKVILPVHLYGCPADLEQLKRVAQDYQLYLIEDACQAHGASLNGVKAGAVGDVGCFSFYPTKNLGAVGDAGMVVTNSSELAEQVRKLRNYGETAHDCNEVSGFNSRLDELQAAVLSVKLRHLDSWNERRRTLAQTYVQNLNNPSIKFPQLSARRQSNFHLFVAQTEHRDQLRTFLGDEGIETAIHYPRLIYQQPVFKAQEGGLRESCPVAERAVSRIVSIPLYPQMTEEEINLICTALQQFEP